MVISYIRFVSFLLTVAHSRANDDKSTSVDNVLFEQIEKLSKQIIKPKDGDEKKDEKKKDAEAADEPDSCWSPPEPKPRGSSQAGF